jgi:hypothetical protein
VVAAVNVCYRITDDALYEATRLALDEHWGHPHVRAVTCINPAAVAPRDTDGNILLSVRSEWLEWPIVQEMLPQLLASGVVTEITEEDYHGSQPPLPPPY